MEESLLIVDDEQSVLKALRMTLEGKYVVHTAKNGSEAMNFLQEQRPALILLDIGLPDISGMELLEKIRNAHPEIMVVMVTAVSEVRMVVKSLKLGAYDYLVKPIDAQELKLTVKNTLESKHLKDQIRRIQQPNIEHYKFDLIGRSTEIKNLIGVAKKLAKSVSTPVLIVGESGTGKGVLARAIHYSYSELPGPFVTVNCTAITHELFESELFGYDRGAFTGAKTEGKKGRFEDSAGGTIFLDEIGSMSLSAQSKLLGVLEDRVFYKVGGIKAIPISSRIIAATNLDLENAVEKGLFRKDLFFRLNVVKMEIPPLRERPEDIIPLSEYFMEFYNGKFGRKWNQISTEVKKILLAYSWPGNVRELRNTLERTILLENGNVLLPEHISFLQSGSKSSICTQVDLSNDKLNYEESNKTLLQKALRRTGGNVVEAAHLLSMPTHKLRYRIKKYKLQN
jgi:DNA-binding NtrC family response regulator